MDIDAALALVARRGCPAVSGSYSVQLHDAT
jgi:hypothetical protein